MEIKTNERSDKSKEHELRPETNGDEKEKFAFLIENSSNFISMCDLRFKPFFLNKAGMQIVGLDSIEQLKDFLVEDFFFPEDRTFINEQFLPQVIKDGRGDVEIRFRHFKTGEALWMVCSVLTIKDVNGDITSLASIGRNITDRKYAEEKLKESETQLHALTDSIPQLVWMAEPDGYIFWYNRRWYQYTGTTQEQMQGWGWQSVHDPSILPQVIERWKLSISQGLPFEMEFPLKGADGNFRWFLTRVTPQRDSQGNVTRWFGTNTDIQDFRQMREVLLESEERFRQMADNAPVMIWVTEHDGKCSYLSKSWYEFTGQTPEASLGFGWIDATHPDDRENAAKIFLDANKDHKAFRIDYRLRRRDGEYRWAIDSASPRFNSNGEFMGYIGSVIDITDRKRAEEALRMSEERYRSLVTATAQVVWTTNADGSVANVPLWRELTGQTEEENSGWGWLDAIHPDDRQSANKAWTEAISEGSIYETEYRVRVRDGSYRYFVARGIPVTEPNGEIREWIGVCIDIHDAKVAELRLRESEERFRTMADTAPVMIWVAGTDKGCNFFNKPWLEFTGNPMEQELGNGWAKGIYHEDYNRYLEIYTASFDARRAFEMEYRLKRHDGEYRWILDKAHARYGPDGNFAGYIGSCIDITDRKQIETEREELLDRERTMRLEVEEASRLKDEFLATLSHELRTPLTSILGWSRMLRTGTLNEMTTARALETIERNAKAQTQLVEDVLDVSRIITGKLRLDVRPTDLSSVVENAVESIRPAADAKGVRLQITLDPKAGPVSGDSNRLQQVAWNLLSNAVKFTPKGGRVQVRVERRNSHIEIGVSDTGKGIQAHFLPFVFERFRQADSSTTRTVGGLGLGLAIVRHLVELHGGTVIAESPGEGQGATFTVKLPLLVVHKTIEEGSVHPAVESNDSTLVERAPRLEAISVVVIDDEPDTRDLLQLVLAECGATVHTASSVDEGLYAVKNFRPDVIISDIGMPEEDGYSFIRKLREWEEKENMWTPAIALTAFARAEDRLRVLESGYQMHVPKPVELTELVVIISSLVKRPNLKSYKK